MKRIIGLITLAAIILLVVGYAMMGNAQAENKVEGKIISNKLGCIIEVK